MESPFLHQLRLQSVLPRDIIHVTILTLSITRAPAVNLTDVCTGTLVSKCKLSYYVHLFRLKEDVFLSDCAFHTGNKSLRAVSSRDKLMCHVLLFSRLTQFHCF